MTRLPALPSPPPPPEPYFDPVEEWLVDLDLDLDRALLLAGGAAMAGDLAPGSCGFCPDEAAATDASEQKSSDLGVVMEGSVSKGCDPGVMEAVEMEKFDGIGAALEAVASDCHAKEEVEMGSDALVEAFGSNQIKGCEALGGSVSASGDLVLKEEVSEGIVDAEMRNASSVKELDNRGPSVGKGDNAESSEEESEESESSDGDDDDDGNNDGESSEASSSSEEEEKKGGEKDGGRGGEKDDEMKNVEACLEEFEMVGSDEEEAPKGPIRSMHEVEVSCLCFKQIG